MPFDLRAGSQIGTLIGTFWGVRGLRCPFCSGWVNFRGVYYETYGRRWESINSAPCDKFSDISSIFCVAIAKMLFLTFLLLEV